MKLLRAVLTILVASIASAEQNTFYVKPSNSSSSCPDPCLTLDEYSKHPETYFTSGATFLFLVGNHSICSTIHLEGVYDITFMENENDSFVVILSESELATFNCCNVTNFVLQGITVRFFTGNANTGLSFLSFMYSKQILLKRLSFQGNFDPEKTNIRAALFNYSSVTIENCLFEGNTGYKGGAIHATNESTVILSGNTFLANTAVSTGGAIYVEKSFLMLKGNSTSHGNNSTLLQDATLTPNIFQNNSAEFVGGAIGSTNSVVVITGEKTQFTSNYALLAGGAYFGNFSSFNAESNTQQLFENNSASIDSGGAIHCQYGSINFAGSSQFLRNWVGFTKPSATGGAIFTIQCNLTLSGRSWFGYNYAPKAGAVGASNSNMICSGSSIYFLNNSAALAGGGLGLANSTAMITTEMIVFVNNSVTQIGGGGGLYMEYQSLVNCSDQVKNLKFVGNTAQEGGGVYCIGSYYELRSASFIDNRATKFGGAILVAQGKASHHDTNMTGNSESAIYTTESNLTFSGLTGFYENGGEQYTGGGMTAQQSTLSFEGITVFKDNHAGFEGGAIMAGYQSTLSFSGQSSFINNTAVYGGAIASFLNTNLKLNGNTLLKNNVAQSGGALFLAKDTSTILKDNITFESNSAEQGGAMYFENDGSITMAVNTYLDLSYNYAAVSGGGIYYEDSITPLQCNFSTKKHSQMIIVTLPDCFLKLDGLQLNSNNTNFTIVSKFNSAKESGDFIFGGLTDKCRIVVLSDSPTQERFYWDLLYTVLMDRNILKIDSNNSTKVISSEPYMLCFCETNTDFNCTESTSVKTYRGRKITLSLVALAQGYTVVSSLARAQPSPTARIELNESAQHLSESCNRLSYTLYSIKELGELILYPDQGSCHDIGLARAVVNVTFLKCPDAFNQSGDKCTCEDRLLAYNAECIISETKFIIRRKVGSKFWVTALYSNEEYEGLILYKTCPTDYCKTDEVDITLDEPDSQCDSHHSGMLCGACANNYSLTLGSSRCELCSNNYLLLLLSFAAAGMVLVIFLSLLRLTVANGMVNSIILYANILQANRSQLFPGSTKTSVLTVFIAWMNLDLGFQTCFYKGMTAYAQTWLQFAFPFYVWSLISLIIVTSRYSSTMTKLIGSNPIAVLATLLLMSYTKILKNIIEIYSFVYLDYPNNKMTAVWLKDANVPYFRSRHLLLVVVTTLFVGFVLLPYTLFLLFGYKLYRFSRRKYLRWLIKFKPLLDSYYAPYEKQTRYWTGLLLIVRCALYIVFSNNSLGSANRSLLSIVIAFTALVVLAWLSGKVYTSFYANLTEGVIYLNLIFLSSATSNDSNSEALANSLIGLVFFIMMGIILSHIHLLYIAKSSLWLKVKARVVESLKSHRNTKSAPETAPLNPQAYSSHDPHKIVTKTEIDVREPLLIQ